MTVDHYISPMSAAWTHVWVEAQYRPRTILRFLFGPKFTDNYPLVEAVRPKVSKGGRLPTMISFGNVTTTPELIAVGEDLRYAWRYDFHFVGTGTLYAWPQVDGQMVRITVPFEDHQNLPRPADAMQRSDW